jgi:hypothetical protein
MRLLASFERIALVVINHDQGAASFDNRALA